MGKDAVKMDTFTKEYPLTSYQKRIWMQRKIHSEECLYNIGGYIEVDGEVDYDTLCKALNIVVNENDTLRIIISKKDGEPFYKFLPRINCKIGYHDFSAHEDSRDYSTKWQKREFMKTLNICEDVMFKVVLIKIGEGKNHILFKFHRLIIDHFGISLLHKRFMEIYNSLIRISVEAELFKWLPNDEVSYTREIDNQVQIENLNMKTDEIDNEPIRFKEIETEGKKEENCGEEEVVGEVPLTPIQKTFFNWKLLKPSQFNKFIMIIAKTGFNEKAIRETLTAIVKHHDLLRAIFKDGKQEILSINSSKMFQFKKYDLRKLSNDDIEEIVQYENNKLQSTFDLSQGPLVKAALYQTLDGDYLMVCIHHLVVDSFSWKILIEDFQTGYNQYIDNKEVILPKKSTSYKEWANELIKYSESEKLLDEIEYWKRINESLDYGKIANNSNGKEYGYGRITFKFNPEKTSKLLYEVEKVYVTEVEGVLLGSLVMAYKLWRGKKKLLLKLEANGREKINKKMQLDRTVGWFASIFPIVLEAKDSLEKSIVSVKEMLRNIPEGGIGYNLIKEDGIYQIPEMDVDISFNYLGEFKLRNDINSKFQSSYLSRGNDISKDNIFSNIIFTGYVTDGQFNMEVWYNKNKYSQRAIEELVRCYEGMINEVIENFVKPDSLTSIKVTRNEFKKEKSTIKVEIKEILPLRQYDTSNFVNTRLFKELTSYDDKNRYGYQEALEILRYQKYFATETTEGIFCARVDIRGTMHQKNIITVIRETVKEQSVFRISYDKENRQLQQYKYTDSWYLPYIDISNNDNIEEKFEILESVLNMSQLFEDNRLLAKIVIVKVDSEKHYIYFYVQATLWNEISVEGLGESIKAKCFLQ